MLDDDFEDATQVYDGEYPMSAVAKQEVQVIAPNSAITPMDMLNQAVERGASLEVIEKMMGLQERWEANQARKLFDEAVSNAKAEIPPIARNKAGHNSKKYVDFSAIAKVVDPIITKHGLSYRFTTAQDDRIHVTCILSHRAGHFEKTTLAGPSDTTGNKNAIQAIGSTLTYLQRYSLVQMLGLAASDDDDAKAAGKGNSSVTRPEDVIEEIQYDQDGNPINNIPLGDPSITRMSKAMAKPEYALMQSEIRNISSASALKAWGAKNANRTATLPVDWQDFMRDCYRGQLEHLEKVEAK